jgi:hypothetical protein
MVAPISVSGIRKVSACPLLTAENSSKTEPARAWERRQ